MTRTEFNELFDSIVEDLKSLNTSKGKDYAGDEDALQNFKIRGLDAGVSKYVAWSIYAGKHWDAVQSYIRNGQVESEPIEGRINDLLVYLFLLRGMIAEDDPNMRAYRTQVMAESYGGSV